MTTSLSRIARYSPASTPVLAAAPRYSILVAGTPAEVAAAQRLRHLVFAGEMGATLRSLVDGLDVVGLDRDELDRDELDRDEFDEHCDHLIVREDRTGEIVGTYRMLPPHRAAAIGRSYCDGEFDLATLAPLRDVLVETGRSCVHPEHRSGAVINLMWAGIARYLHLHGHRWLAGCASVPVAGDAPSSVWQQVRGRHLSPPRLRVTPRVPYPLTTLSTVDRLAMPPLLRGYLRLGAWVGGEPALDTDFGVADFFVLLSLDRIDPRYMKHFLGEETASNVLGAETASNVPGAETASNVPGAETASNLLGETE
jgi:putative hemolysin